MLEVVLSWKSWPVCWLLGTWVVSTWAPAASRNMGCKLSRKPCAYGFPGWHCWVLPPPLPCSSALLRLCGESLQRCLCSFSISGADSLWRGQTVWIQIASSRFRCSIPQNEFLLSDFKQSFVKTICRVASREPSCVQCAGPSQWHNPFCIHSHALTLPKNDLDRPFLLELHPANKLWIAWNYNKLSKKNFVFPFLFSLCIFHLQPA